jgi:hypothetical protein
MKQYLLMIVISAFFIGCEKATGDTSAGNYEDYVYLVEEPVVMDLDELTFEEAFALQYRAHGEGHIFWWRGSEYVTNLHRTEIWWSNNSQWVRNSDDLDDDCWSNEWDECGICDGPGKITWYKDNDADGLGNPNNYILSCNYPGVDEE